MKSAFKIFIGVLISTNLFANNTAPNAVCPTLAMSGSDVTCYGDTDGAAYVSISNGSGSYTITWSNGVNSTMNLGLSVGTYTVNVKDNVSGCTVIGAFVVGSPDPIITDESITHILCNGDNTGSVDVTTFGGTTPYNFSWSNGFTTEDLNNVTADNYTLNIQDFKGCTYSEIYTITEPLEPLSGSVNTSDALCFASATGSIDITTWGGTPAYSYLWNTGQITQDINGLATGNYSVTVTDYNGCTISLSTFVDQPEALSAIMSSTDVLCYGESTGTATATMAGGTAPYNYSWQNSLNLFAINNATLSNIPADIYQVTVTDDNGCLYIDNVEVFEPADLQLSGVVTNVSCYGGSDGAINVTLVGGTPTYSYNWTDDDGNFVSNSQDLVDVPADVYELVATDFNGCTETLILEVTQPLLPISATYEVTDVLCFGENTGEIDLTASGGTPPYSYSWSSGQTSEDLNGILAGNYIFTIIDANGCIESGPVIVSQPAAPLNVVSVIQDVNCFGESNGSILLTVTGGTTDYSFAWQNSTYSLSYTDEDLINFPADDYRYEVTDANGCQEIDTLTIGEPEELIAAITPTHVLCYGEATGVLDLSVTGGTLPYQYYWDNGPVTEDQIGVYAGDYAVTVIDDHGCVASDGVTIQQPSDTISFTFDVYDVSCNNGTDGAIDLFISGGTPGYGYLWSNGSINSSIEDLTSGYYAFTITDANNCIFEDSIFVNQPDPLDLNAVITPVTCYGLSDGIIDLSPTGGTPPFSYSWYDSTYALATQTEDLNGFTSNLYQVEVVDSNGCFYEEFFELPQPDSLIIEEEIKQVTCYGWSDGAVFIEITGGNPGYTTEWSNSTFDQDLIDVVSDTFNLVVTDTKGCTDSLTYFVPQPDTMTVAFEHDPVSCIDQADGVGYAFAEGGNGGYSYLWDSGSIEDYAEQLDHDYHVLVVTDVLGCTAVDSVFITRLEGPCIDPPNAFTPNDDNYNDRWQIDNVALYPDLEILIFNKWGNKIHFQRGDYEPWDGTINGSPAPSDTYYYVININYLDREPVRGNVTILR